MDVISRPYGRYTQYKPVNPIYPSPPSEPPLIWREKSSLLWLCAGIAFLGFDFALPIDQRLTVPAGIFLIPIVLQWSAVVALLAELTRHRGARFTFGSLIVVVLLSCSFSAHAAAAFATTATWTILGAGVLAVAALTRRSRSAADLLLGSLAAGGALNALWFGARWLSTPSPEHASWTTLLTPYPHFRYPGLYLTFSALASLALILATRSPLQRIAAGAAGLLTWSALFWTGSRAGAVALFVGCGVLYWTHRHKVTLRRHLIVVALLGLSALAVSSQFRVLPPLGWSHAIARTATAPTLNAASSDRGGIWSGTLQHIVAAPLFGHGPDSYRFLTPKLVGNQPHNTILQILVELGVAGLFGVTGVLICCMPWRALLHPEAYPASVTFGIALCTAGGTMALFDGVLYHGIAMVPLVVCLGFVIASPVPLGEDKHPVSARGPHQSVLSLTLGGAAALATLHAYVVHGQLFTTPAYDSISHRVLRWFPSTLAGYGRWIESWEAASPGTALEATIWAQAHGDVAYQYHIRAAGYFAQQGDYARLLGEWTAARDTAPQELRAGLETELRRIRQFLDETKRPTGE